MHVLLPIKSVTPLLRTCCRLHIHLPLLHLLLPLLCSLSLIYTTHLQYRVRRKIERTHFIEELLRVQQDFGLLSANIFWDNSQYVCDGRETAG